MPKTVNVNLSNSSVYWSFESLLSYSKPLPNNKGIYSFEVTRFKSKTLKHRVFLCLN
jgi:hypothetical protein